MFNVLKLLKANHFEGQKNVGKGHEQGKDQELASLVNNLVQNSNFVKLTSAASAGGGATEQDVVVTGLLATDLIVSDLNVDDLKTTFKSDTMADGEAYQRVTAGTLSAVDHLDLTADGFTLKAAAHSADDDINFIAYEGKNE